jgi:N-acetylglucosaminyldiphosphoundecaprenol N-acetyl-beta-D-mannosaminyltransferase
VNGGLPSKQLVVSVGISTTSYAEVVEICSRWAAERKTSAAPPGHYVCITSVHGIMLAKEDPQVARYLNEADIATPDGMPVVWALRSFGYRKQERVYGPALMLEICRCAAAQGHRIFLYGARDETLSALKERLTERFPDLQIAGVYAPPFGEMAPEEDQAVQLRIRDSNADIVFVGISTPKQERWMYEHRYSFPGVTLIGVGAAFDFHAGRVRQAPAWMQRSGLEWLFRLLTEPARLWRRYLLTTPKFLPLWAKQKWFQSHRGAF